MTDARDTFGKKSDAYAVFRPRYPIALYEWLLAHCPGRAAAWDCATGNGQAAVDLARYFKVVHASDISVEQVAHGEKRPNIVYAPGAAEKTDYPDELFDLVTVAQALHWFDYERFWPEAARVSKPGALFCAWGYAWFDCDPDVERRLVRPFRALIEPFWARNNAILWRGYGNADIHFPYRRLQTPAFAIEVKWTLPQLIAYMQTWSAYKRSQEDDRTATKLASIVEEAEKEFAGRPPLSIAMPLKMVAGYIE
ncbi:MAG TPA: class I SAM-dependent methyltransferase [Allosphingosinicella sp.]|jgi:ubiquinone/menaquinone biosynthesis C-methylase UbiE